MLMIGLTGGSGSGKSAAAPAFEARKIPVADCDAVAREVTEPGEPCLAELCAAFGPEILLPDGTLHRKKLAALALPDPAKRQTLNRITHAHILQRIRDWAARLEAEGCRAAAVDAPQLFESGLDCSCGRIIAVTAPREVRLDRIIARDGISREAAERRLAAQYDDAFFAAHADAVLVNDGTIGELIEKTGAVLDRILAEEGVLQK